MKHKLNYRFFSSFLVPFFLAFVKEIKGMDNVPHKVPYVIVVNHASYIDPGIIKAIFDRHFKKIVFYLTKKEVYNNFLKKFFFESAGTIQVDRQKHRNVALDAALKKLKEGEIIGLFPEGTRSRDGKLHQGKTGAVRLALFAKCPILPIGIKNTYELWPPHKKLPKFKKIVVVNIGKPIILDKFYNKKISKKLLDNITEDMMKTISKLSGQEYVKYI